MQKLIKVILYPNLNRFCSALVLSTLLLKLKKNKKWAFSGRYFSVFGLNTEIYSVNLPIQSDNKKIRTRNNSIFGHFSHFSNLSLCFSKEKWKYCCFPQKRKRFYHRWLFKQEKSIRQIQEARRFTVPSQIWTYVGYKKYKQGIANKFCRENNSRMNSFGTFSDSDIISQHSVKKYL